MAQVVAGALVSLFALLTVQLATLRVYVDVFAVPGQRYDELGRRLTGWDQTWHQYGSLLWGVYALVVALLVVGMWRIVLARRPGAAAWWWALAVLAASTAFWWLSLDRFYA